MKIPGLKKLFSGHQRSQTSKNGLQFMMQNPLICSLKNAASRVKIHCIVFQYQATIKPYAVYQATTIATREWFQSFFLSFRTIRAFLSHSGVMIFITAKFYSTESEFRFFASLSPPC